MSLDLIPVLLLSLLLLSSGGDVHSAEVVFGGERTVEHSAGALVVTGGSVSVPEGTVLRGPLHVLGGEVDVSGEVDGDVALLAGTLVLAETSTVVGTVQHYGGGLTVEQGSSLGAVTSIEVATVRSQPWRDALLTASVGGLLALAGAWGARRSPRALSNVSDAVRDHPLISVTVGALVSLTAISVLVFMAFTVLLLPVAVLGLGVGVAALGYATVALGHLTGRYVPIRGRSAATAVGVLVVVAALRGLEAVPVVGDAVAAIALLTGLGAVLVTYVGLKRFTPAVLPE